MNDTYLKVACGGVVAGFLIGCAGAASTLAAASYPFLKALIFPFALLLICYGGFHLFTGNLYKIGRNESLSSQLKLNLLALNFVSNLLGTFLVSLLIKIPNAEQMMLDKIALGPFKIFLLAIACNFLVCLGVKLFKISPVATYLCIALFVACGFEHSIADMYYLACVPFSWLDFFGCTAIILVVTTGNIIGAYLLILTERIMEHES